MEKLISVIIPNWNGMKYLEICLNSLRKQTFREFETIIVDNGSTDGSVEFIKKNYPEIEVIELPENKGFSVAINEGIRIANGKFIALLNNDVAVAPNWLEEMIKSLEENLTIYSFASKMLKFNSRNIIDSAGDLFSKVGIGFNRGSDREDSEVYNNPKKVFSPCAGAAIYRKSLFDEIGLFDEDFFAYYEDVDLGFRAQLNGYQCLYVPTAIVYHVGGATSKNMPRLMTFLIWRNSIFVLIKNMPTSILKKHIFKIILFYLLRMGNFIRKGEIISLIKGGTSVLKKLNVMLNKRQIIQSNRKILDEYIESHLCSGKLIINGRRIRWVFNEDKSF